VTVARETQAQRIARQKRSELLDGAIAELLEHGWRGLQMQAVAKRVGVSRQTMYNSFDGREGLAAAMIDHLSRSFLEGFETHFLNEDDPIAQWRAGIHYLLQRGSEDPALRAMLGPGAGNQFLELLTSGSGSIVTLARPRMTELAELNQPGLDHEHLLSAVETITRMVLSNIVQSMDSVERIAEDLTAMVTGFLKVEELASVSAGTA
jgi:AcrR family transcriptional regulator